MTARTPAPKPDPLLDAAWARALHDALVRYQPTPLFDAVCRELGNPLSVAARCA